MTSKSLVSLAALTAGLSASLAGAQITIPTVHIGDSGNTADPATGYGAVGYAYNIGRTEVTNAQYAAFLNAKAASDPHGLYNASMNHPSAGGITRSGAAGSYSYAAVAGRENKPVNLVTFWDAARFVNWLHNGQGHGDTETGAYTLTAGDISANSVVRNAGAQWAITSEDEWYKAAYFQLTSEGGDADSYWLYGTSSNSIDPSQANYSNSALGNTAPVGSYSPNFSGAFDMAGNVWEWNESVINGTSRGRRGGSYVNTVSFMRASTRGDWTATEGLYDMGFRVVQIPGPSSVALLGVGAAFVSRRRR